MKALYVVLLLAGLSMSGHLEASGLLHAVILAGGRGERLWPYTRAQKPKYLLPFRDKRSLLVHTIERARLVADQVWVVTDKEQEKAIREHVADASIRYIVEPSGRDTAPAILLSVLTIKAYDPNSTILFLPADHFVPDAPVFARSIRQAQVHSQENNNLCLLGLAPRYPATQYGYIQGIQKAQTGQAMPVRSFCEKPSRDRATQYLQDGDKLWNLGIIVAPMACYIDAFKAHAPQLYNNMVHYCAGLDNKSYATLEKISFDYAVLEKSAQVSVLPVSFVWDDVGCLDTFLALQPARRAIENVVTIDANNNLVDVPGKLVALVGVDNLCIIEHDGALIVVPRERVQDVRKVVAELKNRS